MKFLFVFIILVSCIAQANRAVQSEQYFSDLTPVRVRILKNQRLEDIKTRIKDLPEYFQQLKIIQASSVRELKQYDLILTLNMRDYLAGVLSGEMPLTWPLEALKSQAVVARSYALAKMIESQLQHYDVDSDHMDQVFKFKIDNRALKAIDETRDLVLSLDINKSRKFEIVKAYYHSDCGGQTVPAQTIWPGAVDTGITQDPMCLHRKNDWTFFIDKKIIENRDEIKIKKNQSKIIEIAGYTIQKLRQRFGFSQIKNSPINVQLTSQHLILTGKGYGHGAGLCQWGSRDWALRGFSYKAILRHYYPKVELLSLEQLSTKKSLTQLQLNQRIIKRQFAENIQSAESFKN